MAENTPLSVSVEVRPDCVYVTVTGDVDISNSAELALRLEGAARKASGEGLTIDLSGVRYMDSSALRALLKVRSAHAGIHLIVQGGTLTARIIDISGLREIFEVERLAAH